MARCPIPLTVVAILRARLRSGQVSARHGAVAIRVSPEEAEEMPQSTSRLPNSKLPACRAVPQGLRTAGGGITLIVLKGRHLADCQLDDQPGARDRWQAIRRWSTTTGRCALIPRTCPIFPRSVQTRRPRLPRYIPAFERGSRAAGRVFQSIVRTCPNFAPTFPNFEPNWGCAGREWRSSEHAWRRTER